MRRWLERGALILLGCVAALAFLEAALRVAGAVYSLRQENWSRASIEADGTYRILCIGESTTAGIEARNEAYPRQLEEILNSRAAGDAVFRVVNGGVISATSDVLLAALPERLDNLKPHIVVAMMGINDGFLIDPGFQVGGRWRVWKLVKMLYHTRGKRQRSEMQERLIQRAAYIVRNWPAVAADLAERAARSVPEDPRPWLTLAEAKARLGESQHAQQLYTKVLALEPAAVLAYSFGVTNKVHAPLDAALAYFPDDANALATRAFLALREQRPDDALRLARQATTADPDDPVALVIEGSALLAAQLPDQARSSYQRAINIDRQLAAVLAQTPAIGSPVLSSLLGSKGGADDEAHADDDSRRWFVRPPDEMAAGAVALRLMDLGKRVAEGDTETATHDLAELAETSDPQRANLRLSAVGQLAVLAWQAGDREAAEAYHREIEDFLAVVDNPVTRKNYRELLAVLRDRGIQLVAVQYPMRRVAPLERLLEWPADVVFVDNEEAFKSALLDRPAKLVFTDLFAGEFGHLTALGNRIIADNVADAILGIVGLRTAGEDRGGAAAASPPSPP